MGDLLLLRHCKSSGQAPDAPLSVEGARTAERLAAALCAWPIDQVISSPYLRAMQTIGPFAAARGLATRVDPRLRERELSAEPVADFLPEVERTWRDFDHRLPGGESSREAQRRGRAALDAAAGAGHRLPVLSTHGNLLTLLLHSIDPSHGFETWRKLANPDLFLLTADGRGSFTIERVDPGV